MTFGPRPGVAAAVEAAGVAAPVGAATARAAVTAAAVASASRRADRWGGMVMRPLPLCSKILTRRLRVLRDRWSSGHYQPTATSNHCGFPWETNDDWSA